MAVYSEKEDAILFDKKFPPRIVFCRTRTKIRRILASIIIVLSLIIYAGFTIVSNAGTSSTEALDLKLKALANEYGRENVGKQKYSKDYRDFSWYPDVQFTELNYTRLIAPKSFPKNYRYVYVVHSRVGNRLLRDVIRRTWALDLRRFGDSELVFLLGYDESRQESAQAEAARHDDIVQYNLEERYSSLTKKSILMLEWANETLTNDSILVKSDDDVLVNVFNLREALQTLVDVAPAFMAGKMIRDTQPERDPSDKWYVSLNDYADEDYPPYLAGCLYVITGNWIASILRVSRTTKLTPMEDVYITGILAEKLNIIKIGLRGISSWEDQTACEMHDRLARHYVSAESMLEIHHSLRTTMRICEFWLFTGRCWCVSRIESVVHM